MNYYAGPWDYEANTAFFVYHPGLNVSIMSFLSPTTMLTPVPMKVKASMPSSTPAVLESRETNTRVEEVCEFKLEIYMIN